MAATFAGNAGDVSPKLACAIAGPPVPVHIDVPRTCIIAQMYTMGTLLRHGSVDQKRAFLPRIASGELRLQAFGVTERRRLRHDADEDHGKTHRRSLRRTRTEVWISRAEHSDLLLLVARTTPVEEVRKRTEGCRCSDRSANRHRHGLTIRPIRTMMNHATTELFFDDLEIPARRCRDEGQGFRYLIDG